MCKIIIILCIFTLSSCATTSNDDRLEVRCAECTDFELIMHYDEETSTTEGVDL